MKIRLANVFHCRRIRNTTPFQTIHTEHQRVCVCVCSRAKCDQWQSAIVSSFYSAKKEETRNIISIINLKWQALSFMFAIYPTTARQQIIKCNKIKAISCSRFNRLSCIFNTNNTAFTALRSFSYTLLFSSLSLNLRTYMNFLFLSSKLF